MNLADRKTVQTLLKKHDITPRRHWGQNFLVSPSVLQKTLTLAAIRQNETILEVGGGLGVLTVELAKRAKKVVVIERDPKLFAILTENLASYNNVELHCDDARNFDTTTLPRGAYRFIANLPYSVGTVLTRRILASPNPPQESFLVLQHEVAERIAAKPPRMHLLSLAIQLLAEPKVLFRIPAGAMWPVPNVESALIRLTTQREVSDKEYGSIMEAAKRGFSHPRKYVLKNLKISPKATEASEKRCGISPKARAQELTIGQWKCLATTAALR